MNPSTSRRIAVVVSQGQSQNPQKRDLEENIVTGLMFEPGIDVTVVSHLYDLKPDGTGLLALQGIKGDLIVCSWLFERAAHWILNRSGIQGQVGTTLVQHENEDDLDDEEFEDEGDDDKSRVSDSLEIPNRKIYCLDLKVDTDPSTYIDEVKRIQSESQIQVVSLGGLNLSPNGSKEKSADGNGSALSSNDNGSGQHAQATPEGSSASEQPTETADASSQVARLEESAKRRWYPVIDYSRCTNCMECIDFCLFGVYGIDKVETILVEQPDNCRKGCPACSRVCPENAIMFPQHKTPAIAGSDDAVGGLKIDLSKLFGAPDSGKDAIEVAVMERDEQLMQTGRDAVGMSVGIPRRQTDNDRTQNRDELDDLIDSLDDLEL